MRYCSKCSQLRELSLFNEVGAGRDMGILRAVLVIFKNK